MGVYMHMQPIRQRWHGVSRATDKCFWQAEHIGHAFVTSALHGCYHEIVDRDTARPTTSCWGTHMEPNVPRTKASLSRAMMRLGVLMRLTCHHHAHCASGSISRYPRCHMTMAVFQFEA